MMNRRRFGQCLAASAGAIGLANVPSARAGEAVRTAATTSAVSSPAEAGDLSRVACVADFEELARLKLPRATFDYITAGSTDQITLRENVAAFGRIKLLPPILIGVDKVDPSTTVLKQRIDLPILLAPVGGQRMFHPDGAVAAARAAGKAGTIYGLSTSACSSIEEVAAAGTGTKWFQLYVPKDREVAEQLVRRAERAGYGAIIVTVDLGERKDADLRHRFALPHDMLLKHLTDTGFKVDPQLSYPDLIAYNSTLWDKSLSWDIFAWLRDRTKLPILVKGVLRREDAQKAASIGLDGIVVSNHGGRRLDGMPASIDRLPEIVDAVGGRIEILLDSGVRRGTDVLKAIALGANAVLVGRAYAWALAAGGEA
ncbi:MAG: alpha-hydroxy acid oxidase, partial [Tepidisphaeraceae bacterium]